MHNYYQIRHWHSESRAPASTPLSLLSADLSSEEDGRSSAELAFDRNYVKQKLDNGLVRIWRVSVSHCHLASSLCGTGRPAEGAAVSTSS